jgi:putative Ca2+/H+ antiporter (TMEM165/GDT1 family)
MTLIFFTTFAAVFIAEIVGDKLLYTTSVLAARYRTAPDNDRNGCRVHGKDGVAVLVGEAISRLPRILVATITAISFLSVAVVLWRKPDRKEESEARTHAQEGCDGIVLRPFSFLSGGDVGQVTAATLTAKYHVGFVVWLGAVSAMVTKGVLAAFLGAGIRRWIQDRVSPQVVRYAAVILLIVLGCLSVGEILVERV